MCYANEPLTICKSCLTETVCRLKTKMMKGPVLVTSNWIIPLDPIKLQVSSARGAESLQDEKTSWCSSMNYDCDGGVTWFTTTFPNLHTSWKFPEKVKLNQATICSRLCKFIRMQMSWRCKARISSFLNCKSADALNSFTEYAGIDAVGGSCASRR